MGLVLLILGSAGYANEYSDRQLYYENSIAKLVILLFGLISLLILKTIRLITIERETEHGNCSETCD